MTSDDDDNEDHDRRSRPAPRTFDAWSSDSSSHAPSTSRVTLPTPNPKKMTSAGKQAASIKSKDQSDLPKPRQSYIGPIVSDPDEPLSEEEDFERFKMSIRFQKIIEFHQAAAHADIDLAIAIYKGRMAQSGDKHEVLAKVTSHQKHMIQLQMEKEEERKNIVKAERSKRRSELRRRPGRSGTLIAPRPSVPANPSWLTAFQDQVADQVESAIVLDQQQHEGNNFLFSQERYIPSQDAQNGWAVPRHPTPPKKPPIGRPSKQRTAKPSLFGDDPDSSDDDANDEQQSSPSPPVTQPHPFMDPEADSMFTQHMLADPELFSYIHQWDTTGELPTAPPASAPPPTTPWALSQHAMHTPTTDNPDPWKVKDVRSTPVATRRKTSISAPPTTVSSPYAAFVAEQSGVSLATLAAFNSANANAAREKQQQPITAGPSVNHHPDDSEFEPDDLWKRQLQKRVEDSLSSMMRDIKEKSHLRDEEVGGGGSTAAENRLRIEEDQHRQAMMGNIKSLAAEQYRQELERERNRRRQGAGGGLSHHHHHPPPEWTRMLGGAAGGEEQHQSILNIGRQNGGGAGDERRRRPAGQHSSSSSSSGIFAEEQQQTQTQTQQTAASPQAAAKADPSPLGPSTTNTPALSSGKKPNKKQRQAMKKANGTGAGSSLSTNATDQDSSQSPVSSPPETTPTATTTTFPKPHQPPLAAKAEHGTGAGVTPRGRRDSTTASWSEGALSTPRPASKVPAHLQELSLNRPVVDQLRASPFGMSTIKASASKGSALKNRTAWSIFSGGDGEDVSAGSGSGSSKARVEGEGGGGGLRDPWIPGSFGDLDDGAGGQEDGDDDDDAMFSVQKPSTSAHLSKSASSPTKRGGSSIGSGSGKFKKGAGNKGKKVTVEEVPDEADDQDSRGERLPVDHRYIMESSSNSSSSSSLPLSSTILEPKPSVPPRMFESIFGFGDDDDAEEGGAGGGGGGALSSELFDGDPVRFFAAAQEMQEASAKMERKYSAAPVWAPSPPGPSVHGGGGGKAAKMGEAETAVPVFSWGGVAGGVEKNVKKGGPPLPPAKAGMGMGPGMAPAIQNLKRSKAAASGGKLL